VPNPENIRLAVLIDADNTSPKHAEAMLEEVAKYGVPTVRRAYGDWTDSHLSGWMKKVRGLALQPMLQVAHTSGKNSTDSALIIDAMDLLYSGNVDAFALVSSDSDFTSLATRLRASGKTVYGLGLRKTPESLRRAVDRFIFLEDLDDATTDDPREEPDDSEGPGSPATRRVPDLRRLLERAITSTAHDDGWASLSSVANHVIRVEPSFSVKDYDASKLVDLVRAQSYVDVDQPESGPVRVRLAVGEAATTSNAKKAGARKASPERAQEKAQEKVQEKAPAEVAERALAEKAPAKKAATKKSAAKKSVSTRTRKRTTISAEPSAAVTTPEPPAPEPAAEAGTAPAGKPQVTTRKRSSRSAKPL
jgi:uncharacterized LabA/DUF88 family protein